MSYVDFGSSLEAYLRANTALVGLVGTAILPDFRGETVPALVYDVAVDETERTYASLAAVHLEVTLTSVASGYGRSVAIAQATISALDGASWSDQSYDVLSAYLRTTEESSVVRSGQSDRLATVSIVFDVLVKRSS